MANNKEGWYKVTKNYTALLLIQDIEGKLTYIGTTFSLGDRFKLIVDNENQYWIKLVLRLDLGLGEILKWEYEGNNRRYIGDFDIEIQMGWFVKLEEYKMLGEEFGIL